MTGPGAGPAEPGSRVSPRWARWRALVDLDEYDSRWERQTTPGSDGHGEADLVCAFGPRSVLDAGCGTGRVAVELDRRGVEVTGVDLDDDLLAYAWRRAPDLDWRCADLATMDLGRRFDVIVQAGNVVNYCRPEDRPAVVATAARHLDPGGRLIVGFSIEPGGEGEPDAGPGSTSTNARLHAGWAKRAGLELEARWAGWDRAPVGIDDGYAVFVHRRPVLRRRGRSVRRSSSDRGVGGPGWG